MEETTEQEKPKRQVNRGPQFFRAMTTEQIDALEEFARHPGKTVDEVHEHLTSQGIKTSRSAVGNWLQDFRLWDRSERSREIARDYLSRVAAGDDQMIAQASLKKFQELVHERLFSGDEIDDGAMLKLSISLKTALAAQQTVNELKKQQIDAIRAAEAAAKSGATAVDALAVIKKHLRIGGAA